ncbi:MAG: hypothetical protein AABX54_00900 [Nanoarchaeota archaeon]
MTKKEGKPKSKAMTRADIQKTLIDNFISMQKVLTNLAIRFDELSTNISKMLQLFEISAKSFAEKYSGDISGGQTEVDKEFLKKLDSLLEQNKVISKGIMLMEDRIKERSNPGMQQFQRPQMQRETGTIEGMPNMPRRNIPRY